jgi:hypothetical protein
MRWEALKDPGAVEKRDVLRILTPFLRSQSRQSADDCYFTASLAASK